MLHRVCLVLLYTVMMTWCEYINEWIRYQIPVHHTDPTEHHRISALYNLRYKLYKTDKDELLILIMQSSCLQFFVSGGQKQVNIP